MLLLLCQILRTSGGKIPRVPILPNFKIFLWKLLHSGLPLGGKLRLHGMNVDPYCSLCHTEQEVPSHLFRDCPMISHICEHSSFAPFCPPSTSRSFSNWCACFVSNMSASSSSIHLLDRFGSLMWTIWVFVMRCDSVMFLGIQEQ